MTTALWQKWRLQQCCASACVCVCVPLITWYSSTSENKPLRLQLLVFKNAAYNRQNSDLNLITNVPQAIPMKWDMMSDGRRKWNSYQTANATQCVIGIINWVSQLVNSIIGFAVSIETHTHRRTVRKTNQGKTTVCVTNAVSYQYNSLMLLQKVCWRFETFQGKVFYHYKDEESNYPSYEIK